MCAFVCMDMRAAVSPVCVSSNLDLQSLPLQRQTVGSSTEEVEEEEEEETFSGSTVREIPVCVGVCV